MLDHVVQVQSRQQENARPSNPILAVRDLELSIGGSKLLHGLSFSLEPGEVVGLVGESGSGKSLTGLSILGLQPSSARITGSINFDGAEVVGATDRSLRSMRGAKMSMISQEPRAALNPVLPVGRQIVDVVRAHAPLSKRDAADLAMSLLEQVGIPNPANAFSAYPHELSGGMCQRVMIAMALSCGPQLLVADEPTTALDVTIQAQIVALLRSIADTRGLAVLLISHDLGMVTEVCDRVITLYCGEVVNIDDTEMLVRSPIHPYPWAMLDAANIDFAEGFSADVPPALSGQPANPAHPPQGCRFHPRCPFAAPQCIEGTPPLIPVADGRWTRCVRHDEIDLRAGHK